MKAFVLSRYGSPEVLVLKDVPKPVAGEGEVLIKIHATAINDYDWSLVRGKPLLYRLMFGLLRPRNPIPGMELAGTVVDMGPDATLFKVGDAVYGDTSDFGFGTFAEYIAVNEKALQPKPADMTFEQAAALPHASALAMQGLIEMGKINKSQRVLINGAGGGVGTIGLQLAKEFMCEVTGVDSGAKMEMMRSLGFDHVIDYQQEDFTRNGRQYDLILDTKTTRLPYAYQRSLTPGGRYVTVGGSPLKLIALFLSKGLISNFSGKHMSILALKPNKGLDYISALFQKGKIEPLIDGPFPLLKLPQALQYFGDAKHGGKVIISIDL
ncbi:MAG: NAD(P)-dependent alcohol dehydrogenase [Saprospiraceae bacterium]|nr:NAD(P)-dependent alcohol dehydrogenase [Saprospiraceae bacterium]